MLNIINVKLKQLKLHLLPNSVTLCFTYADDDDDLKTPGTGETLINLQTGAEDGWVWYLMFRCRSD